MAKAEILAEVLDDGTIRFETDRIPEEHHEDAEKFLEEVKELLGAEPKIVAKRAGHVHQHEKGQHTHVHETH